jgi:hypothetical protein
VRPGCGCEEVIGICVMLFAWGFLFFFVRFFFCSVLRSVVGSLNCYLCAAGSVGDDMGSGDVMTGWFGLVCEVSVVVVDCEL